MALVARVERRGELRESVRNGFFLLPTSSANTVERRRLVVLRRFLHGAEQQECSQTSPKCPFDEKAFW